jgi:putative endonuclease
VRSFEEFQGQSHTRGRGRAAEQAAADWLEKQGFRVLERNVVTRAGEIDAVALEGDTLCFVEVKARAGSAYGPAITAVPARKQRRLARSAALYLARRPFDGPCRFDVLGMDPGPDGWRYTLIRNAFELG